MTVKQPFRKLKMCNFMVLVILPTLISCTNEYKSDLPGINFGKNNYYDSFLFSKSSNTPLTKTLKINFNDWAQQNDGFADLYFLDNAGNKIGTPGSEVNLFINDVHKTDGIIQLSSSQKPIDFLEIKLRFASSNSSKNFSGYLILQNGNIERINNIETKIPGVQLFKWNAKQEVVMNPLKKGLLWFLAIIASSLLVWFLLIRNKIYSKMTRGQIILNTPYYKSIKTKGARQIIFTNKHHKQGWINKLFAGKIIYEKNDFWQEEIKFSPARRQQLRIKMPAHYNIAPFTSKIDQGKTYTLKGNQEEVKFSFL